MTLEEMFVAKDLRFDHHPDGFGIGTDSPRLSWRYASKDSIGDSEVPGHTWSQKSYVIEVQSVGRGVDGKLQTLGNVRRMQIVSDRSTLVPWVKPSLQSREQVLVRVVGHNSTRKLDPVSESIPIGDGESDWISLFPSSPNTSPRRRLGGWTPLEVGLLEASDWEAKFITSPDPPEPDNVPHRPTIYRKTFDISPKDHKALAYARLYISSLGLYEAYINGQRVGDHHLAPGWTSYHHRVQYQTFDASSLLKPGKNVIAVEVAEGWYAGRLTWVPGLRNLYGDKPAFIAQLEIHHDGSELTQIISDNSWACHPSPRLSASIYDGEAYDAREVIEGLHEADFDVTSTWKKTRILNVDLDKVKLVSTDAPPVRVTQTIKPIDVFTSPSGKTLVDFGQNLVGRIKIHGLQKPSGHSIKIRHAEVLENGELGTRPLRDAKATDEYVFSGKETTTSEWTPLFTFHGFRYIEITGWTLSDDVPPSADTLSAHVVGSDMTRTGHFHCSNDLVNKLHENVTWSMRGNFVSVPTDCPQRDERLGWTGDLQAFAPTASFLYASGGFLTNWLRDLSIDQASLDGIVPVVIPDVLHGRLGQNDQPVAIWDDAAVLVPWTVYQWTGDVEVLQNQFPSMDAHLHSAIRRGSDGLWDDSLFQYGDWLDPNAPPDNAALARTDGTMVADAYLVHVTDIVAQVAVIIGNAAAARSYQAEFDKLKRTFADKYISNTGLVVGDSQTALALAICFNLLATPSQRKVAGARLARLVRQYDFRVSTGFAGTPLVLHALTQTDQTDLAYQMLLTKECPSWLYPVTMGATTIWERWDSMLPDGRINPGDMTSFNHYALGSVANWLHTVVGGVEMLEPGWKTFRVRPRPGGDFTSCEVSFEGPYGRVGCQWVVEERAGNRVFKMRIEVPPNTRAWVVLPGQEEDQGVWKGSGICKLECEAA